jgi:hypothetical protein
VLKLISIPIVTVFGLEFGSTLAFRGRDRDDLLLARRRQAHHRRDQLPRPPVMVAYLVLVAALFVTINVVVDLVYALLDPRLRPGAKHDGPRLRPRGAAVATPWPSRQAAPPAPAPAATPAPSRPGARPGAEFRENRIALTALGVRDPHRRSCSAGSLDHTAEPLRHRGI